MIPKYLHTFLLLVIIAASFLTPIKTALAENGYDSLFNGTDLSGWTPVGTPDAFTVRKNAIYTTGAGPYPSWLRSEKEYENFIFRFEYQTEGWYEGGVLIHAPLDGPASKLGLKLHLRHDQKEYGVRSPGAIYNIAAPKAIANHPSGQWNQCEIECDWPTLRVKLNGTWIHDIDMDTDSAFRYRLRKGFLGIQNIGCHAYFRNLEIRPLPAKEKWTELFDSGFDKLHFQEDTDWTLENNILTGRGKNGFAITNQEFEGPLEFQVWVKTVVNGNGGVHFNWVEEKRGIEVQCFNAPDSTNPTGSLYNIAPAKRIASYDEEWFLLQIFVDGPNAMVIVNGEKVCETDQLQPPFKGAAAFQQHTPGATIQYRDARIKNIAWR